jgi:hypothetical protein
MTLKIIYIGTTHDDTLKTAFQKVNANFAELYNQSSQMGATGPRGLSGATGLTGNIGATGTTGLIGATGSQGITGATGIQGTSGATGSQGATGLSGVSGATGLRGATGTAGATGSAGSPGAAGATGVTGSTGATGIAGAAGVTGSTGATGPQGATGPSISNEIGFQIKNSNFSAVVGGRYAVDSTSSPISAILPSAPQSGDSLFFADAGKNFTINNLTLARNGNSIDGSAQDYVVSISGDSFGLVWTGSTWRFY